MARLVSCSRCGKIHPAGMCPLGKIDRHRDGAALRVHRSARWTRKAIYIKDRDHWLCQACLHGIGGDVAYTSDGLEVHHIVPISQDKSRAFDDDNLITLCRRHHEMAESEQISRQELQELIDTSVSSCR